MGLWHEAERVRAYLGALAEAVEARRYVPADRAVFDRWLAWAGRYADAIDPLVGVRHPEDVPPAPRNTPAGELDVTSYLQQQLAAGQTKVSLALKGVVNADTVVAFNSREAAGNPPQLMVSE